MELNYSEIFNKQTIKSLSDYCTLNDIKDVDRFIKKCFNAGFNIEKYGLLGKTLNDGEKDLKMGIVDEKQVIKEVIVEKRVEVPVEVIKEIEKVVEIIKEVPIEVIKEVPVEKIVTKIEYISDKKGEDEMTEKIFHLNKELESERKNFSTKKEEMENFFQNEMSKKENELDELRRNLDIKQDDNKLKMLQTTIQNLTSEVRELKKKNEELEKQLLDTPKQTGNTPARFHGSSNLNDDLYR